MSGKQLNSNVVEALVERWDPPLAWPQATQPTAEEIAS